MAKSKSELMTQLTSLQKDKTNLDAKVKGGDTSEATRSKLDTTKADILSVSEELKVLVTGKPGTESESDKAADKAVDKAVDKAADFIAADKLKKEYKVKKSESHLFHVIVTKGARFDSINGKEISKPFVQTFDLKELNNVKKNSTVLGLKLEIIHEPTKG